jgi:uncharacterized small protein (DUF1192 family)
MASKEELQEQIAALQDQLDQLDEEQNAKLQMNIAEKNADDKAWKAVRGLLAYGALVIGTDVVFLLVVPEIDSEIKRLTAWVATIWAVATFPTGLNVFKNFRDSFGIFRREVTWMEDWSLREGNRDDK